MENIRKRIIDGIREIKDKIPPVGNGYRAFNEVQIEIETKVGWLLFNNEMTRVEKRYYEEQDR